MRKLNLFSFTLIAFIITLLGIAYHATNVFPTTAKASGENETYWLMLHRKSNIEYLYYGTPGNKEKSSIIKKFDVMTGVPGQKPTPLPELFEREYWLITDKVESADNVETAPFFLTLDIPTSDTAPFGPTPYTECNGSASAGPDGQCNWTMPGNFGLHGIAGDPNRIYKSEGSSGCIRHKDEDITYLYHLLDPSKEEIRYYIKDI